MLPGVYTLPYLSPAINCITYGADETEIIVITIPNKKLRIKLVRTTRRAAS